MSQDQLQIFHAAFQPPIKSPKTQGMRGLEKLLNRERANLEVVKDRIERLRTNAGEPEPDENREQYVSKLGLAKESDTNNPENLSSLGQNEKQNRELNR